MAQFIPHPFTGEPTHFTKEQWRAQRQGELFSPLPRQLPIYKAGPEDEVFYRLANRGKQTPLH